MLVLSNLSFRRLSKNNSKFLIHLEINL